jgi:hypothetical protein
MSRASLIPFGISILALAIVGGVYFFWYQNVTKLSAHAADLLTHVNEKDTEIKRISAANATFAALSSDEAAIAQYFVADNKVVPFLEEIQSTGKSFGSSIEVVSVSAETIGAPHLTVSLKIDGTFDAVVRTLGALEYAPRDIVVNDIALTSTPGAKGESLWSATGTFTVGTRTASAPKPSASATTTATTTP